MFQKIHYTTPQLCDYGGDLTKNWFIYFDVINETTGVTIRKQFRGGINKIKDLKTRTKEGNSLAKHWGEMLQDGWTPFKEVTSGLIGPTTPLNDALDFALSKVDRSGATLKDYGCTLRFAKAAATKVMLASAPLKFIEQEHIMLIMEQIKKDRNWSNKAYNKNLGYLCAIIGRLVEWKVIKHNPAEKIKTLPVDESEKFIPLTEKEKQVLRETLYMEHYRFFVYLMVIYHTGIRPKEVLALTIKDIDLVNETIIIYPDSKKENAKTKKIRKVPINPHLMAFFKQMELYTYPGNYYVFGSPYESGKGNRGSSKDGRGAKHPDYFKPSPTHIKRDTTTKLWKSIVIDKLGINKHQYALKHTGANDKILAGIDLDVLQSLYGHESKLMTLKYVTEVKQIHANVIKEKSPSF
jgi:integrase